MNNENHLNDPYPLTNMDDAVNSKEKILLAATMLFAKRGIDAVSMRDIASSVNLRPASIYNHFESKEKLWDAILEHLEMLYLLYFKRLEAAFRTADCYRDVLDCMFSEVFQVVDIFTYYGFSLIQAEQVRDEKAYRLYQEIFFEYSISFITKTFDDCIEKGWARSFDTQFTATVFMHQVLIGIIMRAHEDSKHTIPYDVDQMFQKLYQALYDTGKLDSPSEEK